MKDFFGQELFVGDTVAMTEPRRNSAFLVEGTIESFAATDSCCYVQWKQYSSLIKTRRVGTQLVKKPLSHE